MDNLETTEAVETTESEAPEEIQEVQQEAEKPVGWQQVEFTPEQQERVDYLYKQVKDNQRTVSEYRRIAKEQASIIQQLQQGQTEIVSHIRQDDFSRAESNLLQQQKDAYERGDLDAFNKVNAQLIKLETNRALAQTKQPPVNENIQPVTGVDIVNEAVSEGSITYSDAEAYKTWANETDQFGNHKRPWIQAHDLRNTAAASEGYAVFNNPQYANLTFAQKLQEIDKRMGIQTRNPAQAVMPSGSNLTRGTKNTTIKLSPQIERVAVRTKFAGPGKSDAEHIEAYKKQIDSARRSK